MQITISRIELLNMEKMCLTDEVETDALIAVRIRHHNSVDKEGLA
jgi:hypothetical protein